MHSTATHHKLLAVGYSATALLICFVGCDDPLPAYAPPDKVLENSFYSADTFMIEYYEAYDDITLPGRPKVSYSGYGPFRFTPEYQFLFSVKNVYEETVQGQLSTNGLLEVWLPSHPTVKKSIPVTNSHVMATPRYSIATRIVTLEPGGNIVYSIPWRFDFDNGKWLHQLASATDRYVFQARGSAIYSYQHFEPQPVTLRFFVSLIDKTPVIIAESTLTVQLRGTIHSYEPGPPAPPPNDQ